MVDVNEQAVFADRQAWRMILERRRVVGADADSDKANSRAPCCLEASSRKRHRRPGRRGGNARGRSGGLPRGYGATELPPWCASAGHERLDSMPDSFFNDRVVCLDSRGHPLVALLPLLTGHVAERRHVRVEQHVLLLRRPETW